MKSILQRIINENKNLVTQDASLNMPLEENPTSSNNRRDFLKKTALG
jgi:hypothetical protein